MVVSIWGNIWRWSAGKKSTSSFTSSLSYLFIAKILWTCPGYFGNGYAYNNWYHQFIEKFRVYLQAKNQLHLPCFSEDWLSAFWPITREPYQEFYQIWWNINNTISFHFRLFPQKINDKIFPKKNKKKGQFGPFLLKFGQKWLFMEKRALPVFNNPNIYHHIKNQKKLMSHSWEKCWTDGWADRQTTVTL